MGTGAATCIIGALYTGAGIAVVTGIIGALYCLDTIGAAIVVTGATIGAAIVVTGATIGAAIVVMELPRGPIAPP
jgi:hypothetical protein